MSTERRKELLPILKRFLIIFLPLLVIFSLIFYRAYDLQATAYKDVLKEQATNQIDLFVNMAVEESEDVFSDLLFLSGIKELRSFLNTGDIRDVTDIEETFHLFCEKKMHYDQLRFIDETGMEITRINCGGNQAVVVPQEELQNKADRYYFTETMQLSKDEIYVSPLDLNVENGEIEIPYKPMIRIAVPLFDDANNRKGIIILNYLAEQILHQLATDPENIDQYMLLNSDGYWLYDRDPEKEWGFMVPGKESLTFGNEFPEEWITVSENNANQFISDNGLFTFETLYPLLESRQSGYGTASTDRPSVNRELAEDYYWKVIIFIPAEKIDAELAPVGTRVLLILCTVALVLGIGSWIGSQALVKRKIAEDALKQANEDLEDKVRERTAELRDINDKLISEISERHIAEQQNTLKSEFLSYMSHEIRTPLNAILGFSEILLDGIPGEINDEQKECLVDINDSGKHLLGLINDLLDLSKIEAGKMIFKPAYFDLNGVIDDVEKTLRPLIDAKSHTFTIGDREETATVFADEGRVRQVLLNLLSNAIKYTPDKGTIHIEYTRKDDVCQVTVTDNGIGIKEEDRSRMFEVYIQAETLQEESMKGTGLGLALTRQFVEAMGGEIWLESTFGEGSSFSFTVPVSEPESDVL